MPALVSTNRRIYSVGEDVDIRYQASAMVNILSVLGDDTEVAMKLVYEVGNSGHRLISADRFNPGHYRVLLEDSSNGNLMENEFWVVPADVSPMVRINKNKYKLILL